MSEDLEFIVNRTVDAPRDLVWEVYSKAEHLAKWWGPAGFDWISCTLDFRPGGHFHYGMRAPNGDEMWGRFDYLEIKAPELMVFTNSFSDARGNIARAPFAAISNDWPLKILNRVSFSETNGRTTITSRGKPVDATPAELARFKAMHPSMQQGFKGTFDKLEAYLGEIRKA